MDAASPEEWVTGKCPDKSYKPDDTAAAAPPTGQTGIWSGAMRDHVLKRLFGRLHKDMVYLFNYSTHDAVVAVAMCNKQAAMTEGSVKVGLKASADGADVSGEGAAKWVYETFDTSYYPLSRVASGGQTGTELAIQLQEGCDRAYVTIYKQGEPKKTWVLRGVLKGQSWGCIYRDPVDDP